VKVWLRLVWRHSNRCISSRPTDNNGEAVEE
jgi:hypothetical protein